MSCSRTQVVMAEVDLEPQTSRSGVRDSIPRSLDSQNPDIKSEPTHPLIQSHCQKLWYRRFDLFTVLTYHTLRCLAHSEYH